MIRILPALILAVGATTAAPQEPPAQEPSDPAPVFAALHGSWRGEGTLMGSPASFTLQWRVSGALATLAFENGFVGEAGAVEPALRAAAVYRTTPDRPEGVWLDSRGVRFELVWEATDTTLVVTWTGAEESGRSTYRVVGSDAMEVMDEVAGADGLRPFARSRLVRDEHAGG